MVLVPDMFVKCQSISVLTTWAGNIPILKEIVAKAIGVVAV
jgi:hypothetical protein